MHSSDGRYLVPIGQMEQMESMTPDGLGRCGHAKAGGQTVYWMEQPSKDPFCFRRESLARDGPMARHRPDLRIVSCGTGCSCNQVSRSRERSCPAFLVDRMMPVSCSNHQECLRLAGSSHPSSAGQLGGPDRWAGPPLRLRRVRDHWEYGSCLPRHPVHHARRRRRLRCGAPCPTPSRSAPRRPCG